MISHGVIQSGADVVVHANFRSLMKISPGGA
jgi:hypothetical protein